jgi:catechol 2,3-dioxygenase-like lactoylglutathione lyase family enzyme
MTVQLNHTIVWSRDSRAAARFLAGILGLPEPKTWGPFEIVATDNGVSVDFAERDGDIAPQHYAFLVGEDDFDAIFGRIRERGLDYWADPGRSRKGEINTRDGGRGVYFPDPSGHLMEILTRPYGSGGGQSMVS